MNRPRPGSATARAAANIALIKYWGKRPGMLNLPATGSLSLTLGALTTTTTVSFDPALKTDQVTINGHDDPQVTRRIAAWLDLVRAAAGVTWHAAITSRNDFPTAAGLASSASGFAALTVAAEAALGIDFGAPRRAVFARRGSGSAGRSLYGGFAIQHRGERDDGEDAIAEPLFPAAHWPLAAVIAITDPRPKPVASTDGMTLTARTSPYYPAWVESSAADLAAARQAIAARDFERLAALAEHNCLKMHASALAADPGVVYWRGATVDGIDAVRELRAAGVPVFFTIDAGPQVKAICLPAAQDRVRERLAAVPGVHQVITSALGEPAEVLAAEPGGDRC